ncbi:MAG: hypothetical protein QW548_00530 [Candidatus Aenigmatarchaeota archaeon]
MLIRVWGIPRPLHAGSRGGLGTRRTFFFSGAGERSRHGFLLLALVFLAVIAPAAAAQADDGAVPTITFTVPAKAVWLGQWLEPADETKYDYCDDEYWFRGANYLKGKAYYDLPVALFRRVLIWPNGTEQVLDEFKLDGHVATGSTKRASESWSLNGCVHRRTSPRLYWSEPTIPARALTLPADDEYAYRVELRMVNLSAPTAARAPNATWDSIIDLWQGTRIEHRKDKERTWSRSSSEEEKRLCSPVSPAAFALEPVLPALFGVKYREDCYKGRCERKGERACPAGSWPAEQLGCKFAYTETREAPGYEKEEQDCWLEHRTASGVRIANLAQVYETYNFNVDLPMQITDVSVEGGQESDQPIRLLVTTRWAAWPLRLELLVDGALADSVVAEKGEEAVLSFVPEQPSHNLTIRATDAAGDSDEQELVLASGLAVDGEVRDNEAPVSIESSFRSPFGVSPGANSPAEAPGIPIGPAAAIVSIGGAGLAYYLMQRGSSRRKTGIPSSIVQTIRTAFGEVREAAKERGHALIEDTKAAYKRWLSWKSRAEAATAAAQSAGSIAEIDALLASGLVRPDVAKELKARRAELAKQDAELQRKVARAESDYRALAANLADSAMSAKAKLMLLDGFVNTYGDLLGEEGRKKLTFTRMRLASAAKEESLLRRIDDALKSGSAIAASKAIDEYITAAPNGTARGKVLALKSGLQAGVGERGAAQFGVAWANPSAGGAQTQPRSLWDSFTGALSGLGKAISGFAHDQWNYWSSVGDSVMKGDLKGAGEKLVAGALSAGAFVVDTVKNHWKEIAVGVAIGAALVVAAPIAIPAIATALGVSAGTVTAVVTAAGVAAVGYYAASRYGPILNEINDSCDWRGATDRCAQLRSELGQNALADGAILGGSIGLGKVLSPVVGTALARRIPVEGLTDDAARETYRLATKEIGRTGGYGQYKRIVVTDGRELPELANSRGAVTPDGTLYLNKDFLADWIMHPGIFDWHETGHRAITTGLAKAEPSIVAKTNAGTAKSGPIIEVAADKVAYQLGGAKYAAGWQKYRSVLIKHYIENPPVVGIWPHEEVEIAAWLYVVHKNIGRNDIATDLMSSVVRSNSEDGVQLFNAIVAKFQRAWTKTSIAVPPDAVPASFGNSIKGARNESVCTELGRHGYGGTFAPLFWCLREWKKSTLEKAQFEKRFDYIRRLPHGYDLYRHGVKSGILIPIGKNKWKINRTRLKEIEKQSRKLKLCL